MNYGRSLISFYYLLLIALSVVKTVAQTCEKLTSCSCKAGEFTFSLSQLKFQSLSITNGSYTYVYQPCGTVTCGGINTAAICQRSNVQSAFYDVGDGDTAAFTGSPLNNTLVLTFTSDQRTSNIKISCNRREQSKFTHVNEDPPNTYTFVLETPFACTSPEPPTPKPKHNLSTGSVLLIIFFVFLLVYFVVGILFLKFVRRAIGTEAIPNYEFWSSLPGYIKDGVTFTCRGCKSESSYSQI
ncbi:cation-dependent mannose-6-phosphate receptor-like [Mya arenaria]|uniref:cation-dependent mannose-6-phosphate receptor-like n=1 Tax=Mya arenaria TaxID=6604 RepID=UPI0022E9427B|nr:cation-dependent mannose-6-phosphate receptor-like [Mya arenaria]